MKVTALITHSYHGMRFKGDTYEIKRAGEANDFITRGLVEALKEQEQEQEQTDLTPDEFEDVTPDEFEDVTPDIANAVREAKTHAELDTLVQANGWEGIPTKDEGANLETRKAAIELAIWGC